MGAPLSYYVRDCALRYPTKCDCLSPWQLCIYTGSRSRAQRRSPDSLSHFHSDRYCRLHNCFSNCFADCQQSDIVCCCSQYESCLQRYQPNLYRDYYRRGQRRHIYRELHDDGHSEFASGDLSDHSDSRRRKSRKLYDRHDQRHPYHHPSDAGRHLE